MHRSLHFFRGFLRHPKDVSSIIPSSRATIRRVIRRVPRYQEQVIVEYGSGMGDIARELLRPGRIGTDSSLILIEKIPEYAEYLQKTLHDPRLHIRCDSAVHVRGILRECGVHKADVIISSVPLTVMPASLRDQILGETRTALKDDGIFIAYLFRPVVERYLRAFFPDVQREYVWRNIPPLMIYEARKTPQSTS